VTLECCCRWPITLTISRNAGYETRGYEKIRLRNVWHPFESGGVKFFPVIFTGGGRDNCEILALLFRPIRIESPSFQNRATYRKYAMNKVSYTFEDLLLNLHNWRFVQSASMLVAFVNYLPRASPNVLQCSMVTTASRLTLTLQWKRTVKRILKSAGCKHSRYQLYYETAHVREEPAEPADSAKKYNISLFFIIIQLTLCI